MTPHQLFLVNTFKEAKAAGVLFPDMQTCEAALESGYGITDLAHFHNNLFGEKQHATPKFETVKLPTWEVFNATQLALFMARTPADFISESSMPNGMHKVRIKAPWVSYPTLADCFADRMHTLKAMAPKYLHYAAALAAHDAETFVVEVSKSWSTDPERAGKCINIYHANKELLSGA